jgi:hypothetical protein
MKRCAKVCKTCERYNPQGKYRNKWFDRTCGIWVSAQLDGWELPDGRLDFMMNPPHEQVPGTCPRVLEHVVLGQKR